MDELASFNRGRWEGLVKAGCAYTRPWLDLTPERARDEVDDQGLFGDVAGRDVLCLAGGGGQQSAAFAMLGAKVTVVDITDGQLEADRRAAAHYGFDITPIQGDMRDLSMFGDDSFDIVYHAHSLGFVPDPQRVFDAVKRILRADGWYRMSYANPFTHMTWESSWNGHGYVLPGGYPYEDGELIEDDDCWKVADGQGNVQRVPGPREFRHRLSTVINSMSRRGFRLVHLEEGGEPDSSASPGSWQHFCAIAPPWLTMWWRKGA